MQLKQEITVSQESRVQAKASLADANASNEKAASEYVAVNTDLVANKDALTKTIALEKGVAGSSFLQSSVGSSGRRVVEHFQTLSCDNQEGYAPQSGEVITTRYQLTAWKKRYISEQEKSCIRKIYCRHDRHRR